MTFRNRSCFLIGVCILILTGLPGPAAAGLTAEADSLDRTVRRLAGSADFGEAARVARELRRIDAAAGADDFQLRWYDIWIQSLDESAALPPEGRDDLAQANRIDQEASRLYSRGQFTEHQVLRQKQIDLRTKWLGSDHPEVAYALIYKARALLQLGRHDESDRLVRRSHQILEDRFGEHHFLTNSSRVFQAVVARERGELELAEQLQREAIEIIRGLGAPGQRQLSGALLTLVDILRLRGDLAGAEQVMREALDSNRRADYEWMPNPEGFRQAEESALMESMADLLLNKGNYAEAERFALDALALRRNDGDRPGTAKTLTVLARTYAQEGRFQEADSTYRRILRIREEAFGSEHAAVAETLADRAALRRESGDPAAARGQFERALLMLDRLLGPDHPRTLEVLDAYVGTLIDLGDWATAELWARKALSRRGSRDDVPHPGRAHMQLGQIHLAADRLTPAREELEQAAEQFENARVQAGSGMDRATFGESPYHRLAATHLLLGNGEEAWTALERGQGRVLIELLTASGDRNLPDESETRLRDAYRALDLAEKEFAALATAVRTDSSDSVIRSWEEAKARARSRSLSLLELEHEIARSHPVPSGRPYETARVQSAMDATSAVVGWLDVSVSPQRTDSWGYVLRKNGPVQWFPVESNPDDSSRFRRFRNGLAKTLTSALTVPLPGNSAFSLEARRIHESRVAPLLPALDGVGSLVVVGTGAMSGVPLECLRDGEGNYLGDLFSISYATSATVFAWLTERAQTRQGSDLPEVALLLGDPPFSPEHLVATPLPPDAPGTPSLATLRSALAGDASALGSLPRLRWSRQEVTELAQYFDQAVELVGTDASETRLVQLSDSGELARFSTIHFATHALVDQNSPWNSSLVLSQLDRGGPNPTDGLVTARDIIRFWDLRAELVVLSACETGLGRQVVGEGYVGFAQAFFQAGANSVIASLWKVDDRATSMLMQRFYSEWRGGLSKGEALQAAKRFLREQSELSGQPDFRHPAYWSAFVLLGAPE